MSAILLIVFLIIATIVSLKIVESRDLFLSQLIISPIITVLGILITVLAILFVTPIWASVIVSIYWGFGSGTIIGTAYFKSKNRNQHNRKGNLF